MTSMLRFVEERIVQRPSGDETATELRACTVWADEQPIEADDDRGLAPLAVRFELPDEPRWTTALADHPPRYWQLEVDVARRGGADLRCVFPLPVYPVD